MNNDISKVGNLIQIINQSRQNALKKVNEELINMYWKVGQYLSEESESDSFGDAYIDNISKKIQEAFPGIKGFTRRGLYRMKKFYETYKDDEFVSTLLSQMIWSNHLSIMSNAKTAEERHFYITLCIKEGYSARELERQFESGYYERYMLSQEKLLPNFMQMEAITDTVKPRRLQVFFVDADGAKISFPVPITANIKSADVKDRLIQEKLTLKSGRYSRDQEYFLVIADQDDEKKELHRYKFEIDISDMAY